MTEAQVKALEELEPDAPWHSKLMVKYRLFVGILIASGLGCHIVWWTCAIKYNWFALFHDLYYMTLTMVLGGTVAGEDYFYKKPLKHVLKTLLIISKVAVAKKFSEANEIAVKATAFFQV